MTRYSMTQVETLTGINAHTLRVWERRYTILIAKRTASNIRYYTDEQLKKLLNIAILIRNGYRISKIDKMPPSELNKLVTEILSNHKDEYSDKINGLVISMLEMDEVGFNKIFNKALTDVGFVHTILHLVYPFLNLVGGLWSTSKATPAQEHFVSNLIRQKIISAIENLPPPTNDAKRILMYLLEGEVHEIGLLVANYMAKKLGWKVYYLGQNVPSSNIDIICELVDPDVMMTMFINPRSHKIKTLISNIIAGKEIPLWFSGNPMNFENLNPIKNTLYIKSPNDFETHLNLYENR